MIAWRPFHCTRCDWHWEAKVGPQEAPACRKCKDSEWVNRDEPSAVALEVTQPQEEEEHPYVITGLNFD